MRVDPLDLIGHSISGMLLRTALAWFAIWIGFTLAGLTGLGSVGESLQDSLSSAPLLPLTIVAIAVGSGWWSWIALPLSFILAYRALTFISREGGFIELLLLIPLSFLVCAQCGDLDENLMMIAVPFVVFVYLLSKRQEKEALEE
ncbi:hypothetical protein OJ996_25765 [Luteolibacter sp. GHJ8]|uniref:Uncharacterized protein n=1 Tax=Luteolibacter rhizosphaerae TaxID=2989719 RepID=A0ABT3GB03_9BACT|nr:hypothetical protein [Luteolibacter rhizosphaerae]MCW1917023.1 hypothetical protein [Luteolibacter rhizosphaerae]